MLTKSPGTPGWPKGGLYIPASSGDYFLQNLVTRILSDKELRQSSGIPKTVVRFVTFVPFHPFWLQKVVFWALDEVYQLSHKKSSSQSFTVRANYCCLDQQWPQNHQQGSAIQSADASGVNWGLVTEVRWLMQLGVSKANSMREDKEDMTSGWRQNISPTLVIRGDFFGTILTQTAHCAKGNTSYLNEWSHFIPPEHWESALFHPSSSPIQTI